jgi:hypothetical protein
MTLPGLLVCLGLCGCSLCCHNTVAGLHKALWGSFAVPSGKEWLVL